MPTYISRFRTGFVEILQQGYAHEGSTSAPLTNPAGEDFRQAAELRIRNPTVPTQSLTFGALIATVIITKTNLQYHYELKL